MGTVTMGSDLLSSDDSGCLDRLLIWDSRWSMISIDMSNKVLRRSLTGVLVELNVRLDWYSSRRVLFRFWAVDVGVAMGAGVFCGVGVANTVRRRLIKGLFGVTGRFTGADGVYRVRLLWVVLMFPGVLFMVAVEFAAGLNKVLLLFITGGVWTDTFCG